MTKFPAVNLYSRTPLTQVSLLQFPLDLTKISVVTQRVPFDYQLLSTGRLFKLVLLYNTIMRSDVSLTDCHML